MIRLERGYGFSVALIATVLTTNLAQGNGRYENSIKHLEPARLSDPFEGINRIIFVFNDTLDTVVLRPTAIVYDGILPNGVKDCVRNFVRNLATPVILLNDLLQGNGARANVTASRFIINTTIGLGGLFDQAEGLGLPHHKEDFGQTIGSWSGSEDPGPYLILPVLGPSSARDAFGRVVDLVSDPLVWSGSEVALNTRWSATAGGIVDLRSRLLTLSDNLQESSDDYYLAVKSVYEQNRDYQLRNGVPNLSMPAPGDDE